MTSESHFYPPPPHHIWSDFRLPPPSPLEQTSFVHAPLCALRLPWEFIVWGSNIQFACDWLTENLVSYFWLGKHCRFLGVQKVPVWSDYNLIISVKLATISCIKFFNWPRVLEDSVIKVAWICISAPQGLVQMANRGFRPLTVSHDGCSWLADDDVNDIRLMSIG